MCRCPQHIDSGKMPLLKHLTLELSTEMRGPPSEYISELPIIVFEDIPQLRSVCFQTPAHHLPRRLVNPEHLSLLGSAPFCAEGVYITPVYSICILRAMPSVGSPTFTFSNTSLNHFQSNLPPLPLPRLR